MRYDDIANQMAHEEEGVEIGTMMKTPCLRYKGDFMGMMFEKEDALIVKISADRVNTLIAEGVGLPFNYTKKRFKEWVLIPLKYEADYKTYLYEALAYARQKAK